MEIDLDVTPNGTCTNVFVILGKRRSGKTKLASVLVGQLTTNRRVVVVDPVGSLGAATHLRYHKVFANQGSRSSELFWRGLYHRAEQPDGEFFLAIDEADEFTNLNGNFNSESLYRLLNYGRNYGVGILACSRRAANLPKDFLSNSDYLCLFSHHEPNDLDYLGGMLSDSRGRDYVEALKALPEHVFLLWETTSQEPFKGFFIVQGEDIVPWSIDGKSDATKREEESASSADESSSPDSALPPATDVSSNTTVSESVNGLPKNEPGSPSNAPMPS